MLNTGTFIRENEDIVLLICDFYETKHIPTEMTELKKNFSLFPVANIPMIEYVLLSLYEQGLFSVILVGKDCGDVFSHVEKVWFAKKMSIVSLNCDGKSLGDLMRKIDEDGFEFKNLLVIYANHYTNYPLRNIIDKHKRGKNIVMTLFLHPNESNSKMSHIYGFKEGDIVFYDKCVNGKHNRRRIMAAIEAHRTIEFAANLSSPTIAAISSDIFPLFTENFDFETFGDLAEGVLAFNAYDFRIMCCRQLEGDIMDDIEELSLKREIKFYSREIITLYDYFRFNEDVRGGTAVDLKKLKCRDGDSRKGLLRVENNIFFGISDVDLYEPISNTIIGYDLKFKKRCSIRDSVVGHGCFIEGNIDRCIIWDDVCVQQDFMDHIVFSKGRMIHYLHLETEIEEVFEERRSMSFFGDVLSYLCEVANKDNFQEIDMSDVVKQVSLLRILWSASSQDFVEAFSMFLVEMVDPEDVEGSTINASLFFPVLCGHIDRREEQEILMNLLMQGLDEYEQTVKKDAALRYGYLLAEDELISRSTFKKYKEMLRS